jgi:hypothetical protein
MKSLSVFFVFAMCTLSSFIANGQRHDRNLNESVLLTAKFTKEKVWDAQRSPVYPIAGSEWRLWGFKNVFDANTRLPLDWGRFNDRYLQFGLDEDRSYRIGALTDDVNNSRTKYTISLKLFERDGRFVKVVSKWGDLIGFGSGGFMYVQEGQLGTFFSVGMQRLGGAVTYRPDIMQIKNISDIMDDKRDNRDNRNYDNRGNAYDNNHDRMNDNREYDNHDRFYNTKSVFLHSKFTMNQVWDAKRIPAYPSRGRDWKLWDLKPPFDMSSGLMIDWGRFKDRYLMFVLNDDFSNSPASLIDDVNKSRIRYNVSLKLYDRDGLLIKTISRWGRLIGFGSAGFMYEQEGQLGTFFATGFNRIGADVVYRTDLEEVKYLSELLK